MCSRQFNIDTKKVWLPLTISNVFANDKTDVEERSPLTTLEIPGWSDALAGCVHVFSCTVRFR